MIIDYFEFLGESLVETLKDMDEHFGKKVEDLKVVLLEGHLDIEACKLAQVTVCVRILSSEDGTNLEDSVHVTAEDHLLVELGALCEAGLLSEIVKSENVGTTL